MLSVSASGSQTSLTISTTKNIPKFYLKPEPRLNQSRGVGAKTGLRSSSKINCILILISFSIMARKTHCTSDTITTVTKPWLQWGLSSFDKQTFKKCFTIRFLQYIQLYFMKTSLIPQRLQVSCKLWQIICKNRWKRSVNNKTI